MFVVFRADANPVIGTGHLMRCLALAGALHRRGAHCLFLCAPEGLGSLAERIRREGHDLAMLPPAVLPVPPTQPHDGSPLPWTAQALDGRACLATLDDHPEPDWIVVDHYLLDATWESTVRRRTRHLLAIDDLANRRHDCDLLLDQNLRAADAPPYAGLTPATCRYLLGPRYALLRPEFAAARHSTPRATGETLRLLVMFGGADQADLTGRTVRLLARLGLASTVDVVVGPLYSARDSLAEAVVGLPQATLHYAPTDITALLTQADLAIASPGTSSWERCCLGLPAITLAVADNQMAMAEQLARQGAHLFLGPANAVVDADLLAAIRLLATRTDWRAHMAAAALGVTDGRGAERVAARLAGTDVHVRPATADDAALLHAWRNDPRTRAQSFDPAPITWENHQRWFANALANPARILLIGTSEGREFGCIRFDLTDDTARISIYLDPARQGEGLAAPLLETAARQLRQTRPGVGRIVAEVKTGNEASRRAFLNAGYREDHSVFIQ
ncbi:MAG: UDP-2,4-diacetamido-2,4,6-trideoxy-beta-L-altropyranose hydrolase [Betaproteobacteria bacterium]|nr:UDP-2,4-diacetamido-2,4,6-trideoxy-beta-L-altropyranose hydrolase [Betaproteobacteria bacterium]